MRWKPWSTVAILMLSLVALAGWQYREYLQEAGRARETLHRQAHAIMNAFVGGFQSHRRRGAFFVEQTQGSLEGLVRARDVLAVAVLAQDGKRLLAAGRKELLSEMSQRKTTQTRAGDFWDETAFRLVDSFKLPPSPSPGREGFGRGRGRWLFADRRDGTGRDGTGQDGTGQDGTAQTRDGAESENPFAAGGTFFVTLLLDRSQVDSQCHSAAWLRGSLAVVGGLLLLGVTLAWQTTVRAAGRARLLEIETRHLRDLSQASAGLAHETRNPLGLIRGWAQRLAQSEFPSAKQQAQAGAIVEECDRVTARINQFLAFARPREPRFESIALQKLVEELAIVLEPDLDEKRVTLDHHSMETTAMIRGDREMFRQALFNLIQNAIQASPEGKTVEIHLRGGQDGARRIEVVNCGSPVPDADVDSLFTPYFTTRPDGTGLGLAIVRHIASVHGWEAGYTPCPGRGVIFWLDRLHA